MTDEERTAAFVAASVSVGLVPASLPVDQSPSVEGLAEYLSASYGALTSRFSASELCRAKYPRLYGAEYIVPPVEWWPRVLFLRWWADQLRGKHPAHVAHLYRPEPYNERVGSTSANHVYCCAIDLDFTSAEQINKAVMLCERMHWSPVNFNIGFGVGLGGGRLHVDFWAPGVNKPRWWSYDAAYRGPRLA